MVLKDIWYEVKDLNRVTLKPVPDSGQLGLKGAHVLWHAAYL